MKTIIFLFAICLFGVSEKAIGDDENLPAFDEEILSGVDKVKDRNISPLEISSEADYVANEIRVRQREPTQTQED